MKRLLLCAALLTGCASTPEVPKETKIPVPVSCIKEVPAKPSTTEESALLAMDDYAATLTTWTERLLLKAYSEKADAIIQACK